MPIPKHLYRGDGDPNNMRNLRETLHQGQMQTNLLKGGQGHLIFKTPVIDLIAKHVCPGWPLTHFLSFSEDKLTAFRFGINCQSEEIQNKLENFTEFQEDDSTWSFAIITIDTSLIQWTNKYGGVFHGSYTPILNKFKITPGHASVILIDVQKAMLNYPDYPNYAKVIANARHDKEWLLLPATKTLLNNGRIEYSGILDGRCISEIETYKRLN